MLRKTSIIVLLAVVVTAAGTGQEVNVDPDRVVPRDALLMLLTGDVQAVEQFLEERNLGVGEAYYMDFGGIGAAFPLPFAIGFLAFYSLEYDRPIDYAVIARSEARRIALRNRRVAEFLLAEGADTRVEISEAGELTPLDVAFALFVEGFYPGENPYAKRAATEILSPIVDVALDHGAVLAKPFTSAFGFSVALFLSAPEFLDELMANGLDPAARLPDLFRDGSEPADITTIEISLQARYRGRGVFAEAEDGELDEILRTVLSRPAVVERLLNRDPYQADLYSGSTPSPFGILVSIGFVEQVRMFIDAGQRRSGVEDAENGWGAVHIAVNQGSVDMARLLLEAVFRAGPIGGPGDTALHAVGEHHSEELTSLLIQHGVDIDHTNVAGETPYVAAVRHGRAQAAQALREAGAARLSSDELFETLVWAVDQGGSGEAVAAILEADATRSFGARSVLNRGIDGEVTLFGWIVERTNPGTPELHVFLDVGADPFARVGSGPAALESILTVLERFEPGSLEIVERIVVLSEAREYRDRDGNGLAHFVAAKFPEAVPFLVGAGFDLDLPNSEGLTPLGFVAAGGGRTIAWDPRSAIDCAMALIGQGVDFDVPDNHGFAVPVLAAMSGVPDLACFLLDEVGYDAQVVHTVASTAAYLEEWDLLECILELGIIDTELPAEVHVPTGRGNYERIGVLSTREAVERRAPSELPASIRRIVSPALTPPASARTVLPPAHAPRAAPRR